MPKKTVKVEIPRVNPDPVLLLIAGILKKHKELGKDSPLDKEDTDALKSIFAKANPQREKAKDYESKSQSHNETARGYLGLNKKQGTETPGTGLYHVTQVRDTLLKKHRGNEEKLSEYTFKVVVGQAKSPKPRKPKG